MLSPSVWNILYAVAAVGVVVVVMMISFQFVDTGADTIKSKETAVTRIVKQAQGALETAAGMKSRHRAALEAQRVVGMLDAARSIADDEDIEEQSGVLVRELLQAARDAARPLQQPAPKSSKSSNSSRPQRQAGGQLSSAGRARVF